MLKIALGQFEVIPGKPGRNTDAMLRLIDRAARAGAGLVVFPELAVPGYLLGDTWEQRAFLDDCAACGQRLAAASTDALCVIFGNVACDDARRNEDGRVRKYNAAFVAHRGRFVAPENAPYPFAIKTLQPNYRAFDDTRHFYSLRQLAQERNAALTDLLQPFALELGERKLRLGCLLCEDGWHEDYDVAVPELLACKGVDLLLNLSCSPYTLGKNDKRHRVFAKQAAALGVPLAYVNSVGLQNNGKTVYTFDGSSALYDRSGAVAASCAPYEEELRVAALPLDAPCASPLHPPAEDETAAIYRALAYGIRKFTAAAGIERVVVGASGGIDSAVAAALYADALGPQSVALVNMPSVYNSATTKDLAARLAANLGCRYAVLPIQSSVDATVRQLEATPLIDPFGSADAHLTVSSFARENIQARDRSARVLAGVAAAIGGAFTCNANKSETTVGYSTLYGDQAGFLAALADLWKYQVYALARYLNEKVYRREVIPQASIDIVPSAELSPEQAVDEGKGDPIRYPYHDYLFRAFVERWERAAPEDILRWYAAGKLESEIGCPPGLVGRYFPTARAFIEDLERWWNLYCGMGVAKRIQAPPILAVSRRAFGFDHREAQNGPYYTAAYRALKARLLGE